MDDIKVPPKEATPEGDNAPSVPPNSEPQVSPIPEPQPPVVPPKPSEEPQEPQKSEEPKPESHPSKPAPPPPPPKNPSLLPVGPIFSAIVIAGALIAIAVYLALKS